MSGQIPNILRMLPPPPPQKKPIPPTGQNIDNPLRLNPTNTKQSKSEAP